MSQPRLATSLAAMAVAAAVATAAPARAQTLTTEQGWSVWELTIYKTLTLQAMAQGFDLATYYLILGGTTASAAAFFVANATTAAATYYAYEILWDYLGPLPEPYAEWTYLAKAAGYRAISVARNFGIGYIVAGDPIVAGGFAAVGAIADTGFYLLNDYVWSRIAPLRTSATAP